MQQVQPDIKKCPKCNTPLKPVYFMGDKSEPPDFLACWKCNLAFDPETLKVIANVFDGC